MPTVSPRVPVVSSSSDRLEYAMYARKSVMLAYVCTCVLRTCSFMLVHVLFVVVVLRAKSITNNKITRTTSMAQLERLCSSSSTSSRVERSSRPSLFIPCASHKTRGKMYAVWWQFNSSWLVWAKLCVMLLIAYSISDRESKDRDRRFKKFKFRSILLVINF